MNLAEHKFRAKLICVTCFQYVFFFAALALLVIFGINNHNRLKELANRVHGQLVYYADGTSGTSDSGISTHYSVKIVLPNGREWFDPENNPCPPTATPAENM